MRIIQQLRELRTLGICGVNERSAGLIFPNNRRALYPRVDNKLVTKEIAMQFAVPVPELYGVVRFHYELRRLEDMLAPHAQFVVKPARGAQGKGILLIANRAGLLRRTAAVDHLTLDGKSPAERVGLVKEALREE